MFIPSHTCTHRRPIRMLTDATRAGTSDMQTHKPSHTLLHACFLQCFLLYCLHATQPGESTALGRVRRWKAATLRRSPYGTFDFQNSHPKHKETGGVRQGKFPTEKEEVEYSSEQEKAKRPGGFPPRLQMLALPLKHLSPRRAVRLARDGACGRTRWNSVR